MRIQSQLINIKLESTIENCRTFGRKKQEEVLADQKTKRTFLKSNPIKICNPIFEFGL